MIQSNSTIRCPFCNLINFATEPYCKRCKNALQNQNQMNDPNTVNININFPNAAVQPRLNVVTNQENQNTPQFQQFQPMPPMQQMPQQPVQQMPQVQQDYSNSSEYQLNNQTGFEQWQQSRAQVNPPMYAPVQQYYPMQMASVMRRGSELLVHRYSGMLHDRCVKCNDHISGYAGGAYVSQKYRWHNPLVYIALLSPLIYVILSLALSQRVKVEIPLCQKHLEERKSTGSYLLIGGLASIVAIFFFGSMGFIGFSLLIFLASLIGMVVGYEYYYKPLQISKIENDYIYLKNANNDYLSSLPY